MITIISGTNNKNNKTSIIAEYCQEVLKLNGKEVKLLDLVNLPLDFVHPDMFDSTTGLHSDIKEIQEEYIIPANKFIIISPEYNGGIPGILKVFIDAISVTENRGGISNKKALLIGVSAGRAGNLRGLDQLSIILEYCMTTVYPNKLPISGIHALVKERKLVDKGTQDVVTSLLADFTAF